MRRPALAVRLSIRILLPLATVLASAGLSAVLLATTALPREAAFMSGILLLAALLWSTEAIPLAATALLVIALQVVLLANPGKWPELGMTQGAVTYRELLARAADPILLLFLGGLLLAQAAAIHRVDRVIAAKFLSPFTHRPIFLLLAVMGITAVFSMWMSNTAATAMMIAIAAPLVGALPTGDRFRVAITLAVPFAANLGGMGTPIGSPPNALAVSLLRSAGHSISFLQWMLIAVPLMTVLLLVAAFLLRYLYPPGQARLALTLPSERLTPRAWGVVAIFCLTVGLWLTEPLHGLPASLVAVLPVVLLTGSGLLAPRDINGISYDVLILIAGGIALGAGMSITRLDAVLASALPGGMFFVSLLTLTAASIVLSTFMSNTATANLLLPIAISFAATNLPESREAAATLAVAIALACSAAMALPVSTPPNAIAYATGGVTSRQMAVGGALIGGLAAVLIALGATWIVALWL